MPILRGKNVLLRPYRRSDLPGILSWTNDTEATRYLTEIFDQPYTEKNGEEFLNYALSGGSDRMMFVMADPVTEEYWGQILLGLDSDTFYIYHVAAVMVDNLRRLLLGINLSDKAIMDFDFPGVGFPV